MIIHDYSSLFMTIHDYSRLFMTIHDYPWLPMIIDDYTWLRIHDYSWLFIISYEYSWFPIMWRSHLGSEGSPFGMYASRMITNSAIHSHARSMCRLRITYDHQLCHPQACTEHVEIASGLWRNPAWHVRIMYDHQLCHPKACTEHV